jgi:hypothetical protein
MARAAGAASVAAMQPVQIHQDVAHDWVDVASPPEGEARGQAVAAHHAAVAVAGSAGNKVIQCRGSPNEGVPHRLDAGIVGVDDEAPLAKAP